MNGKKDIVYMLRSELDQNRIYIGYTENLEDRLQDHNNNEISLYSKRYSPWKIETFVTFTDQDLAISFEKYLKRGSGFAFMKKRFLKYEENLVPFAS